LEIVVNTRLLLKNKLEGIGWFSYETLKRITQNNPNHHFIFLFDRHFDEEFIFSDNITPLIVSPQARHPILFYWWFEFSVAGILNKLQPDLFLSPDGYLSLKAKCKQLPVIHDINFEHYPEDLPYLVRKYYRHFFPKFAKKATRIATVSEFSKSDISKQYGINKDIIDVIYNGSNLMYKPSDELTKNSTKQKYSKGCNYFLYVGSLQPRKNISRLFKAFDAFKEKHSSDFKLVVVGEKYYWTDDIKKTYLSLKHKQDVIFTGRVPSEELNKILGAAFALTYVPYFEGFGIPIVEAFNCNTPVITANVTSMPEIAGNAALLVDPFSIESITDAMLALAKDENKRQQLIDNGNKQKLNFSWDKSADLLWQSIERTIKM